MTRPIHYAEDPPPAALAGVVRSLWSFTASADLAPGSFALPPDPCLSLAVVRAGPRLGIRIVGPHLRPIEVPVGPGAAVGGVRFAPDAAGRVLGLVPTDWPDRLDAADGHLPDLSAAVAACDTTDTGRNALVTMLTDRVARAPAPDPLVRAALGAIDEARSDLRVTDLAASLGVSPRTLQRRFRAATGLAPKPSARVRRFLRAVGARVLDPSDADAWGRIAADFGYADQAHLVRECRALTDLPPTEFAATMAPVRHVDVRP